MDAQNDFVEKEGIESRDIVAHRSFLLGQITGFLKSNTSAIAHDASPGGGWVEFEYMGYGYRLGISTVMKVDNR